MKHRGKKWEDDGNHILLVGFLPNKITKNLQKISSHRKPCDGDVVTGTVFKFIYCLSGWVKEVSPRSPQKSAVQWRRSLSSRFSRHSHKVYPTPRDIPDLGRLQTLCALSEPLAAVILQMYLTSPSPHCSRPSEIYSSGAVNCDQWTQPKPLSAFKF